MDLLSLVTSGVNENEASGPEEDILGVVEGWQDDETHNPDVPAVSHKRGLTPFVFVPFEEVTLLLPSDLLLNELIDCCCKIRNLQKCFFSLGQDPLLAIEFH